MKHLFAYSSGYAANYTIDTTDAKITASNVTLPETHGTIENRTFHGPNNGIWNYSVAAFLLDALNANPIFSSENTVSIRGAHSLSVKVIGNFTVGTNLDVSGQEVIYSADAKPLFRLGGFVRVNKSCCTLGKCNDR